MKIMIDGILINYEVSGVGAPLIFLHGWGSNLHTFDKLAAQINEDFTVYQIDLPGFGESEIKESYSVEDYAKIINNFCVKLEINSPVIVGHSFGGRIAIKYAATYNIDKLVLISSPGIKQKLNPYKWLKIRVFKLFKKLKINFNMGSIDYKNASGYLKNTLVKAVNLDLTDELTSIKCSTLLIYGKKDRTVPIFIGKRINKLIENSGLVVVEKAGHFPYIERYRFCLIVLKSFLYGNKL